MTDDDTDAIARMRLLKDMQDKRIMEWTMSAPIKKAKEELMEMIGNQPITPDLLFSLVPRLGLDTRDIPWTETLNFGQFFGRPYRYFFSVENGGDTVYRVCVLGNPANAPDDHKSDGYIGFMCGVLRKVGNDGYTNGGSYLQSGDVELVVFTK
jgi:hypothetical protein